MYQELYLFFLTVFFFFLDLFFIHFFSQQCLYFLYIFALATLPKEHSRGLTLFIFSFLAAESIIIHTTLGLNFFIAIFTYSCASYMFNTTGLKQSLLALMLLIFLLFSSHINILSSKPSWMSYHCTSLKFIGNFIVLYFSLKWLSAVKRGNRF